MITPVGMHWAYMKTFILSDSFSTFIWQYGEGVHINSWAYRLQDTLDMHIASLQKLLLNFQPILITGKKYQQKICNKTAFEF